jgi:hypothetical protein
LPLSLTIAQAHTRATAVLVDEFYAGRLECSPNNIKCRGPRLTACSLKLMDGHNANTCLFRELILAPRKQTASCSALFRCKHEGFLP